MSRQRNDRESERAGAARLMLDHQMQLAVGAAGWRRAKRAAVDVVTSDVTDVPVGPASCR